jgi:uncharacterized protein YjbI with pentapeptide repeats
MRRRTIVTLAALATIVLLSTFWYTTIRPVGWVEWLGIRHKTAWDLAELAIIPLVVAIVAFLFNRSERAAERRIADERLAAERSIADDRLREAALQAYLDRMTELLLDRGLRDPEHAGREEARTVARTRTLTAMRGLDGSRNRAVIQFLREAKLMESPDPIVSLASADLSRSALGGVNLSGANLRGADLGMSDLRRADLSRADLSRASLYQASLLWASLGMADLREADLSDAGLRGAKMSGAVLSGATLLHAKLSRADLSGADLSFAELNRAYLSGADLRGAKLNGADLIGANLTLADLRMANLTEADLSGADLRGADLRGAKYTNDQLAAARDITGIIRDDQLSAERDTQPDLDGAETPPTEADAQPRPNEPA